MKAFDAFKSMDASFWAFIKYISENLGYTDRGEGLIKEYSISSIKALCVKRGINASEDTVANAAQYSIMRADLLNNFAESMLMDAEKASKEFQNWEMIHRVGSYYCKLPLNKQKGAMKQVAFFTAIRAKKAEFVNYLRNISDVVARHDADACKGYLATVEQSGQLAMINGERFSQWADAFQAQIEQAADYVQSSMMELGISQRMLEEDLYSLQSLSDASDEACFTLLNKDALEAQIDTVKNDAFLENCMTALQMMFTQIFNMQNLTGQLIDLLIEGPESTME